MLAGLMPRCKSPWLCVAERPRAVCIAMQRMQAVDSGQGWSIRFFCSDGPLMYGIVPAGRRYPDRTESRPGLRPPDGRRPDRTGSTSNSLFSVVMDRSPTSFLACQLYLRELKQQLCYYHNAFAHFAERLDV